ncbi:MAG: TolC family protein [Pseudomonadota bacterium]
MNKHCIAVTIRAKNILPDNENRNKSNGYRRFTNGLVCLSCLVFLSSCASAPDYKQLRIERATAHFTTIKQQKIGQQETLTLSKAINLALVNNLELKVQGLQESIENERQTAAMLGMLPEMRFTGTAQTRNNEPGSSSESLLTHTQSLEPSRSSEKKESSFEFGMMFSVIDFGLSYYNSQQAKDQITIVGQQKRRQAQNLVVDVTETYLKVAAAQHAMEKTEAMLSISEKTTSDLQEVQQKQLLSGMKAMEQQIGFFQLKQRLTEYKRSYQNNRFQLAALMGYYPDGEIRVDTSMLGRLAENSVPSIESLECIALENRPELMENDVREHVSQVEAHKAILKMFPQVKLFADFTDSSNTFLYNNSWWQVGLRASFDLLNLPGRYYEYKANEMDTERLKAKALALSVGILTEVRIAHANLAEIKERFQISDKLYQTRVKYLETARQNLGKTDGISPLEVKRIEMETVEAATHRDLALASYYMAWQRLLNAVGRENLVTPSEKTAQVDKPKKSPAVPSPPELSPTIPS